MWMKKIRRRKLQSVFIVLIVMVCAMLMTSSLVIMTSWQEPYDELSKDCGSPKVKLYLYEKTKENASKIVDKFAKVDGVQAAEIMEYSYLREGVYLKTKSKEVMLDYFIDTLLYHKKLHNEVRVIEGDLTALKSDGCFVPAALANKEGIQVGDKIIIGELTTLVVQGIYTDPYNMNISFDTELIVSQIPEGLKHEYYISVFANDTGYQTIENYRLQNEGILEGRGITLEDRIENNQMTDKILGGILLAMSTVILFVSGVMIRYMVKNMLLSDTKTVAIYKTIGYQNNIIIGIYLKFYLGLVLIGGLLGAALSRLVSDSFTEVTFKNLSVEKSRGVFTSGLVCIIVILLYVMLCVFLVVKKTKTIRPMEVFRSNTIQLHNRKNNSKSVTGFSPLNMATRMILRDKKNTMIIVITCIMSAFCVNFAATAFPMINGMQENNYYWIGFDQHDVSMENISNNGFHEVINSLRKQKEVKRIIPTTTNEGLSIPWEPGMKDTILSIMLYESFEDINMAVLEGRNPRYHNEIAIGNSVAIQMNKQIGDYLDVYFKGDQKVSLLICGTFQSFFDMGRSCRLLGSTLSENGIDFSYSESSIYLNDGYSVEEFVENANVLYVNKAKFVDRRLKYENIMNMVTGPQSRAIGPFMILALILGGLNIVAIVYLKNKDQRKVFSIYKAIGYSSNHLMKANLFYVFIIALVSLLITVPLFILGFPLMMTYAMSFLGFKEYPVTYDVMTLILSNLGALLVYLMSGMVSSKSLYENPIEDLTCE